MVVVGVVLLYLIIYAITAWVDDCRDNGGTLVRSMSGEFVCIEP